VGVGHTWGGEPRHYVALSASKYIRGEGSSPPFGQLDSSLLLDPEGTLEENPIRSDAIMS
jgi:hypothetical protein